MEELHLLLLNNQTRSLVWMQRKGRGPVSAWQCEIHYTARYYIFRTLQKLYPIRENTFFELRLLCKIKCHLGGLTRARLLIAKVQFFDHTRRKSGSRLGLSAMHHEISKMEKDCCTGCCTWLTLASTLRSNRELNQNTRDTEVWCTSFVMTPWFVSCQQILLIQLYSSFLLG
jgi:hypothetical protein